MKKFHFSIILALCSIIAAAQEATKEIDVNMNNESGAWYTIPWVWVAGAAIFILFLVAATRGNGKRAD